MEKISVNLIVCIFCALCVSAQQSGTLPSVDENNKSSEDNTKFTPITNNSPKFSIGLGVLSPSYTQKLGDDGKIKLDFNKENGIYSYSLNNLVHPMSKSTDRSGSDDKKYSTDTMKASDANSHQLTPSTSQYSPTSYSLSSGSGSQSDFSSVGIGYGSQVGPPVSQSYGSNYQTPSYSPNYGPLASYGPPGYGPMPYQNYPSHQPYSQSPGAYNPSPITPVASNMQSTAAQVPQPYSPQPVASAPAQQAYPAPPTQPQPMSPYNNPYMAQSPYGPSPYAGYGQPMSPYSMYGQPPAPQASPYGGYGSQGYGSQGYGGGGYGMYGSPSQPQASAYPYGGGSSDPLANLSPQDLSTLRQLYGASSTTSMSYMSPYGGMGGGMGGGGMGGGMGGGYPSYGGYSTGGGGGGGLGSGGGLSSLISLFG